MNNIIEVKKLTKSYGELTAINNISFNVQKETILAFLGPNGAGKSTTINVICTTLEKTAGNIYINGYEIGKDNEKIRNNIGVVYQESILDKLLTVRENIETRAALYNFSKKEIKSRLDEIADIVGISEFIDRRYGNLSGGQKRRADIARGLINRPKVLFLDEPTTGLDPQTRSKVWGIIERLKKEGKIAIRQTVNSKSLYIM